MEDKDKARELFSKYLNITPLNPRFSDTVEQANKKILEDRAIAKQCAIICAEEMKTVTGNINQDPPNSRKELKYYSWYWGCVQTEIKKL